MKSMHARKHIECTIKDGAVTNITTLARINWNAFALHSSLLIAQLVCAVWVLFYFRSQCDEFLFIVFQTPAQVFFHFFDFCSLREGFEQVFNSQSWIFTDKSQRILNIYLVIRNTLLCLRFEKMRCNLHPKLLLNTLIHRFVGVVPREFSVANFESQFDRLSVLF